MSSVLLIPKPFIPFVGLQSLFDKWGGNGVQFVICCFCKNFSDIGSIHGDGYNL